jgi:hypothetical protein
MTAPASPADPGSKANSPGFAVKPEARKKEAVCASSPDRKTAKSAACTACNGSETWFEAIFGLVTKLSYRRLDFDFSAGNISG